LKDPPSPAMIPETPDPRPPISLRKKLLFTVLMIGLTLVLAELAFRAYSSFGSAPPSVSLASQSEDWRRKWIERRSRSGREVFHGYDRYHPLFGWLCRPDLDSFRDGSQPPVSTNSRGFRSPHEFEAPRRDGVTRIVVLGDSFTFGEEVGDGDCWPARLEQQLGDVEVFNLAIHGYGTDQQLRVLEEEGLRTRPDVVVVGFFLENILRNGLSFRDYAKPRYILREGELVLTGSPVPSPEEILKEEPERPLSYLWHHLATRLESRLLSANLDQLAERQGLFPLARALLARMKERADSVGARMMVVVITGLHWPMPEAERLVAQWGAELGFEVVEPKSDLDDAEKRYQRSMYSVLHFNPLGNFVTARAVAQALIRLAWVETPTPSTLEANRRLLERILANLPTGALDQHNLGKRAQERGDARAAIRHYRAALRLQPDAAATASELAWILATHPDPDLRAGQEAVSMAEKACEAVSYRIVAPLVSLAAAYAEVGRFEEAVEIIGRAMAVVRKDPYQASVHDLDRMLELFRDRRPYREEP